MTDHKTQLEKHGKSARPEDTQLYDRRDDQSRRAKAEQAHNNKNVGQAGNIRQNTRHQGYQQDR